jgi:SAM-dependent methyltransferase
MAEQLLTFWDGKAAAGTRFTAPGPGGAFHHRVEDREARVLELGCGYGRILDELAGRGYRRLTGVDFSLPMLHQARAAGTAARLAVGSATDLPFSDGAFDAVVAVALFTCIPGRGAQQRVADEVYRVLRPGGLLFASLFLRNGDRRNRERYREMAAPGSPDWGLFRLGPQGLLRHHSVGHLRRLFQRFNWLEASPERFHTMGGHSSRGLRLVAQREATS